MKRIFISALSALAIAFSAQAATTVPVQLLNPTGSTSGQAIVSTGASNAPAWGGIGVNGIAAIAGNSIVANVTGSSASPTAFSMPSCSATANVLQYTSGTGFTCLTTLFSSPTITTPNITGVTNASNAAVGSIGEFPTPSNLSAVSLTSGAGANVASISLTAGDWDVSGVIFYAPASSTNVLQVLSGINTASATIGGQGTFTSYLTPTSTASGGNGIAIQSPITRINVTTTTTVFLVASAQFTISTMTASGFMRARRVR